MSIDSAHALRVEVARLQRELNAAQAAVVREKVRADAANSKLAATDVERLQALSALAAANARADAAEVKRDELRGEARAGLHRAEVELRVSGAAYGSLQDSLTAARRECEQAESERDAASEVLRDALAWEAETRGRLGLPQIDAPMWAQIARAALGDGAALNEDEQVKRLTAAMREADLAFQQVGGSTRHHVRDCLLPILEKHGLRLVAALAAPATAPGEETER